jgi:hypothetical protein
MTESPWISIALVWIVTLIVGGVLWQRFTRVPVQPPGLTSRSPSSPGSPDWRAATTTRRVLPLWLALVLLILLITAIWLTVRWA